MRLRTPPDPRRLLYHTNPELNGAGVANWMTRQTCVSDLLGATREG
jgi:hypothetical protein